LIQPEFAGHLGERREFVNAEISDIILRKIQSRAHGLIVTAAHAVVTDHGGMLNLSTEDPWIEFKLDGDATARFGVLSFDIEWPNSDADQQAPFNRFYLDYGNGYSEELTINVSRPDGWVSELLLAGPSTIRAVRWDPDSRPNVMRLAGIRYEPLSREADVEAWLDRHPYDTVEDVADYGEIPAFAARKDVTPDEAIAMQYRLPTGFDKGFNYEYWNRRFIDPSPADFEAMAKMMRSFGNRPKFSFVMPIYNPPVELLEQCLDSMLAQNYQDFEICVADDCSTNPAIVKTLTRYAALYPRIKVCLRAKNGHISAASNSALSLATGDYVVLVDHDDLIPEYALFVIAFYINKYPEAKILYSDEDKISYDGVRSTPYFKGDFNKFLLYGHNMISHIGVYERDLLERIGGFRLGLEGSQDYDLFMRCYDLLEDRNVVHIPHVLYHWRAIPGSTAVSADQKSYAIIAAQGAINGYFERNAIPLRSVDGFAPGCTGIKASSAQDTSISIIIPTRDGVDILKPCLDSIFATKPENCKVVIVDNQSTERETLDFFKMVEKKHGVEILKYDDEFNFSRINNFAAERVDSDILCFLNNDTEVISPNWLDRARALLALDEVGMVGARLLFPDGSVQHFGITLGMGGHRVAGTTHAGFASHLPGYFGKSRLIQEFSAVTAACMFIGTADFKRIGGFDPQLRVAYNDVDLCLRLRETGLKIVCDPEILLTHKESRTRGSDKRGERASRLDQEAELMRTRWGDLLLHDPYYSPNLTLDRVDFALAYPPRIPMPWQNDVSVVAQRNSNISATENLDA